LGQDDNQQKFTGNSNWTPPVTKWSQILTGYGLFLTKQMVNIMKSTKIKPNVSVAQRRALDTFKLDKNILIQKADKGGSITVFNSLDYVNKINNMLNDATTYTSISNQNLASAKKEVNRVFDLIYQSDYISKKQKRFLSNCTPKIPVLYGLPKFIKKIGL